MRLLDTEVNVVEEQQLATANRVTATPGSILKALDEVLVDGGTPYTVQSLEVEEEEGYWVLKLQIGSHVFKQFQNVVAITGFGNPALNGRFRVQAVGVNFIWVAIDRTKVPDKPEPVLNPVGVRLRMAPAGWSKAYEAELRVVYKLPNRDVYVRVDCRNFHKTVDTNARPDYLRYATVNVMTDCRDVDDIEPRIDRSVLPYGDSVLMSYPFIRSNNPSHALEFSLSNQPLDPLSKFVTSKGILHIIKMSGYNNNLPIHSLGVTLDIQSPRNPNTLISSGMFARQYETVAGSLNTLYFRGILDSGSGHGNTRTSSVTPQDGAETSTNLGYTQGPGSSGRSPPSRSSPLFTFTPIYLKKQDYLSQYKIIAKVPILGHINEDVNASGSTIPLWIKTVNEGRPNIILLYSGKDSTVPVNLNFAISLKDPR